MWVDVKRVWKWGSETWKFEKFNENLFSILNCISICPRIFWLIKSFPESPSILKNPFLPSTASSGDLTSSHSSQVIKLRLKYFTVLCSSNTFWNIHAMIDSLRFDAFVSCPMINWTEFFSLVRVHSAQIRFLMGFLCFCALQTTFFGVRFRNFRANFELFDQQFAH